MRHNQSFQSVILQYRQTSVLIFVSTVSFKDILYHSKALIKTKILVMKTAHFAYLYQLYDWFIIKEREATAFLDRFFFQLNLEINCQ